MTNYVLFTVAALVTVDALRRIWSFYRVGALNSPAMPALAWGIAYIGGPSMLFAYFGELSINGSAVKADMDMFILPLIFQMFLNLFLGSAPFIRPSPVPCLVEHQIRSVQILLGLLTLVNVVSFVRILSAVVESGAYALVGGELRDAAYDALEQTSTSAEHVLRIVAVALTGTLLRIRRIGWFAVIPLAPIVLVDVVTLGRYLSISVLLMLVWARAELLRSKWVLGGMAVIAVALFYYRTALLHISGDAGHSFVELSFASVDNRSFEVFGEFINTYATFHMAATTAPEFDWVTQVVNALSYLLPPGTGGLFLEALGVSSIVDATTDAILGYYGAHPAHLSVIDLLNYPLFIVPITLLPIVAAAALLKRATNPASSVIACYLFVMSYACFRGSIVYFFSRAAFIFVILWGVFLLMQIVLRRRYETAEDKPIRQIAADEGR